MGNCCVQDVSSKGVVTAIGKCPTSSCHANNLGDQELTCPHSKNCPVRDTAEVKYNATCVPTNSACLSDAGAKCLGRVRCANNNCMMWEGVACFTLGSSSNFKVCTSRYCFGKAAAVPNQKGADAPIECVLGGFKKGAQPSSITILNPAYASWNPSTLSRCQKAGTCTSANCGGERAAAAFGRARVAVAVRFGSVRFTPRGTATC